MKINLTNILLAAIAGLLIIQYLDPCNTKPTPEVNNTIYDSLASNEARYRALERKYLTDSITWIMREDSILKVKYQSNENKIRTTHNRATNLDKEQLRGAVNNH